MRKPILKQNKSWAPLFLLAVQIIAQLSVIPMVLFSESWQWGPFILMYCGMMLGITMGYHRLYSHHSYKCPKPIEYLLLFFAHIMMVGPALTWTANHREHHKYADTPKDPHSPYYRGLVLAYFGQVLIDIDFRFARDLLRSRLHRNQIKYYWHILFVWTVFLILIDPMAILYAWLAPAGAAKLLGSLVFTFSHRNRQAHSDFFIGLITLGEGFHSVHHETRKVVWDRFDIGGQLIKLIDPKVKE